MLRISVLATGITNLTDARYFAARGVEALLFDLDSGSDTAIPPVQVKAIGGWVDGVQLIGTLSMPTAEDVRDAVTKLDLHGIQIGSFTPVSVLQALTDVPVYQELVLQPNTTLAAVAAFLQQRAPYVEAFVLDAVKGRLSWEQWENAQPFPLEELAELCEQYSVYLHLPVAAEHLPELFDWRLKGLLVRGGAEEKVGFKSYDELDDWLDALEEEED